MSRERFERVRTIFDAAADTPADQRSALLDRECGADLALRAEVENLLRQSARITAPLDAPMFVELVHNAIASASTDGESGTTGSGAYSIPERIGSLRLLTLIGRGGMGEVYEAEQDHPRRRVAIKVLRADLLSAEAMRRFEHEARVLGRLQHPGIACIHEAGVWTPPGSPARPYFVMELVRGHALGDDPGTRAADARARLHLLMRVCEAVAHAHEAGVIHRDLKPSNILVDDSGRPKIVDFGVARVLEHAAGAEGDRHSLSMHTHAGQIVGTLAYMSPEQISGAGHAVDARSDVYSLGVMLYELLAGRLPLDVRGRPLPEVARMIREDEPSRLSAISAPLRGDPETIVAKAIEKDPARRYANAGEMGADIRRFLADQPIAARPASTAYQIRKFARRHRELVAGIAAAFVVLIAGLVGVSWLAVAEARQRMAAELNAAQAEWAGYRNAIAAADRSLQLADAARAGRALADAPHSQRSWEWRHLRSASDGSIRTLLASTLPIRGVAIVDGGAAALTIGDDGTLQRWRLGDGERTFAAKHHRKPEDGGGITAFAVAPDGRRCVTFGSDGTLAMWNSGSGEPLWRISDVLSPAPGPPHEQAFLPDGSAFAVPYGDRIALLDTETGREVRAISTPLPNPELPAIDPTGTLVMCRIGQLAVCIDLDSGKELWRASAATSRFLAEGGAARARVTAGDLRGGQIVDARTGQVLAVLTESPILDSGSHAGFTATAEPSGTVILRANHPPSPRRVLVGHETQVLALAVDEGSQLAVTGAADGRVKVWDTSARSGVESRLDTAAYAVPRSNDAVIAAAVSGSTRHAATGGWGSVKLWSIDSGEELWTCFPLTRDVRAAAFDPRDVRIAVGGYGGIAAVLHADTGRELARSDPLGDSISQLLWLPERDEILCATSDGRVIILGMPRDGRPNGLTTLGLASFGDRPITGLAAARSPTPQNGPIIAAGNDAGRIWLSPMRAHTSGGSASLPAVLLERADVAATALAFSPDQTTLAAGFADGSTRMWDVRTRSVIWSSATRTDWGASLERGVRALAFTRDGRRLAVGTMHAAVHILDAETGTELLSVPVLGGGVVSLGFDMLDSRLVAASALDPAGITVLCSDADGAGDGDGVRERRTIRDARRVVDELFAAHLFSADVLRTIESDAALPEHLRKAALRIARARGDHPNYLNGEAWAAVRMPGRPIAEYELAVRKADLACELRPGTHAFLNTRGIAEFRAGRLDAASATLEQCIELSKARAKPGTDPAAAVNPLDLCTLAMVRAAKGDADAARALLAAAKERMREPPYAQDEECRWFLAEAEGAIK